MINHARTLLLNADGNNRPGLDFFLEEFVPADFRAVNLPAYLQSVRRILFGTNPSDDFKNFRLAQYMEVLHSTEFESYVLSLDSRVTYITEYDSETDPAVGVPDEPIVEPISLGNPEALQFVGGLEPLSQVPRIQERWDIQVVSPTRVHMLKYITGEAGEWETTFSDGLSEIIPLVGTKNFGFRIREPMPAVNSGWSISVWRRLEADVLDVLSALEDMGDAVQAELFSGGGVYDTFKELWNKHAYFQYSLSGLLLAAIYKTEEQRRG